MQGKILSRKCLRFFKRTFRGGEFNDKYFLQDYKALFSHVYKELNKFHNVEYSSAQVLKDVNEAGKLFDVLEPYVKAVFEYYGKEYLPEFFYGGMDKKTADTFLKELISENKYKEKPEKKEEKNPDTEKNQGEVEDKPKKEKRKKADKNQKNGKSFSKDKNTDNAIKKEDVLIFYDRKSYEAVYFLAKYKFGEPNEKNREDICRYISKFSLKKDKYLNDAVEETLSDEHASGGKKKYSVLDKSVWFELNQTFHFYIHLFHLYDDVYYPELYEKQKREGGLINYFKKFFGITDKPAEKNNDYGYTKSEEEIKWKAEEDKSLDFESILKDSISKREMGEKSTVKIADEIQNEKEPIVPQIKK